MDFEKKPSEVGTIFASSWADSHNPVVLFGHHMKDCSMFAGLERYKEAGFLRAHRTINFSTLYEEKVYCVIAVYYFIAGETLRESGMTNRYHDVFGVGDVPEFLEFLETYKGTYFLDREVNVDASSQFLALQVCTYRDKAGNLIENGKEARLVVLAVEVDPEQQNENAVD